MSFLKGECLWSMAENFWRGKGLLEGMMIMSTDPDIIAKQQEQTWDSIVKTKKSPAEMRRDLSNNTNLSNLMLNPISRYDLPGGRRSTVMTGAGNDSLKISTANVKVYAGTGNDTIDFSSGYGNYVLYHAGDGNDKIIGFAQDYTAQFAEAQVTIQFTTVEVTPR